MDVLPLMEMYLTLQGEGYHQGKPAFFIRLAGCNVGCHWCDVKESWDEKNYPKITVDDILKEVRKQPVQMVVITGGEPLMYDLNCLTQKIKEHGFKTHIETSGTYEVTGTWDWFCLSPKKYKKPVPESYQKADELKIIVYNQSDLEFALKESKKVMPHCHLYLQPEWSKKESVLPMIVDFIKKNPHWRMSLQIHKYINIP
jgi:organic radical activating enzyme